MQLISFYQKPNLLFKKNLQRDIQGHKTLSAKYFFLFQKCSNFFVIKADTSRLQIYLQHCVAIFEELILLLQT